MDDRLLVGRASGGDLDSFGQLYDAYFGRVFDFVWRTLRDGDAAASVTHDVFLRALRELPSFPRDGDFPSWLFAMAYREAVARAERMPPQPAPTFEEAFGSFQAPDPARLEDPAVAGDDHELASLVWEASTALNPRDYALLDLHARQGLDTGDIARLLGVNKGTAATMIQRMRAAADDVLASYIVARRGTADCEGLRGALSAHDVPPYTEQARADVDAHIRGCETCGPLRRQLPPAVPIFAAFAPVEAPLALKGDIWRDLAASWDERRGHAQGFAALDGERNRARGASGLAATGAALGPGPHGHDGGSTPPPWDIAAPGGSAGWDRRQLLWFGGAVVGLLIFAFAGGAIIAGVVGGDDDGGSSVASTSTPGRTRTAVGTLTPGVAVQTATPDLTASAIPPATDTPEPPPSETPALLATDTPPPSTPVPPATATTGPGVATVTPPVPTSTSTVLVPDSTVVGPE
jgi:RNA polymerase sigma factor (sigma-70 family)